MKRSMILGPGHLTKNHNYTLDDAFQSLYRVNFILLNREMSSILSVYGSSRLVVINPKRKKVDKSSSKWTRRYWQGRTGEMGLANEERRELWVEGLATLQSRGAHGPGQPEPDPGPAHFVPSLGCMFLYLYRARTFYLGSFMRWAGS